MWVSASRRAAPRVTGSLWTGTSKVTRDALSPGLRGGLNVVLPSAAESVQTGGKCGCCGSCYGSCAGFCTSVGSSRGFHTGRFSFGQAGASVAKAKDAKGPGEALQKTDTGVIDTGNVISEPESAVPSGSIGTPSADKHESWRKAWPPEGAKVFDLDSEVGRKLCVFNVRNRDGRTRSTVMAIMSARSGKKIMCFTREELKAFCELVPKMKTIFRQFSKI